MSIWLIGFFWGVIVGKNSLLIVPLVALILFTSQKIRFPWVLIGTLGFLWGFHHSAPRLLDIDNPVIVIKQNSKHRDLGQIFADHQGRHFEVTSPPQKTQSKKMSVHQRVKQTIQNPRQDIFQRGYSELQQAIFTRLGSCAPENQSFIRAVLLGDRTRLSQNIKDQFKQLGIYHLLVTSGLHVSTIAFLCFLFLLSPFYLCYLFNLLSPAWWLRVKLGGELATLSAMFTYLHMSGLSHAGQRAFFILVAWIVSRMILGRSNLKHIILFALSLQTVFFPIGMFSPGNILSWLAYLAVLTSLTSGSKSWQVVIPLQLQLYVFCAALLGQSSLTGILLNPLIVPMFPIIMICAMTLSVASCQSLTSLFEQTIQGFLDLISFLHSQTLPFPLYTDLSTFPEIRIVFVVITVVIFLCLCRRINRTSYEKEEKGST